MKKLILTGSLCLSLAITFGQSIIYKEIDFRESKSEINTEIVKTGSRYGLKINNINKKLYIIDNTVTQTSYHETAPALFDLFTKASLPEKAAASSGFSLGDRELVSNEEISAAKLSPSLASKVKTLKSLYYQTADTLLKNDQKLVRFGDAYNELKKSIYFDQDLKEVQNDCNTAFEDIQKKVVAKAKKVYSTTTMLDTDRITLASEGTGYEEIPVLLKRYFTKIIEKDVRDAFKHLNIDFSPSRRDALRKSVAKINTLLGEVISLLEKEEKTNKEVKPILVKFKSERDNEKIKGLLADKMANYEKVDIQKLNGDMEAFYGAGQAELLADYNYFIPGNWTYIVDPQPVEDDVMVISVSIKAKDLSNCNVQMRNYVYKIKAKGGVKIDFSSGLFANFGGNDFKDQTYRYDLVDGSTTQQRIVRNDTKNAIFPSIGALMHIYRRTGSDVKLAGTFGLSTKDLERINYHLGASLIFGTSKRFIISAGATLTKATLITDTYHDQQVIEKVGAPDTIPTSSFTRLGFFTAFTYNLTAK